MQAASHAWEEVAAKAPMRPLPCAPAAPARAEALRRELAALRAQFDALGVHTRPSARVLTVWTGSLLLGGASVALTWCGGAWPWQLLGVAGASFGFLINATIGHTASHDAISDRAWINRAVGYVAYPFVLGLSARYWHHSHVQQHHVAPNVLGRDDDCDLRPVFALHQAHVDEAPRWKQRWFRWQGYALPLLLPLNGFNMQRSGLRFVLREALDPARRRAATFVDLFCLLLHWLTWLVLPMGWMAPGAAFALYAVRVMVMGCALFAILAPGHYPAAAEVFSPARAKQLGFAQRQLRGTVNFRTGALGRLLCSGLEHQIEHHLFPRLSHVHYRRLAPHLKALCARTGTPYHELGWGEAIRESYRVFFVPKRTDDADDGGA